MSKVVALGLQPKQIEAFNSPATEILYGGAAGGGKIVARGASIMTPFGPKKIEDLSVGDAVLHPSGRTQKIVQLHPWVELPKWTVKFHDGTEYVCASDHLWQAWQSGKRYKRGGQEVFGEEARQVIETQTLLDWLNEAKSQQERGLRPNWPVIPVCEELPFNVTSRWKDRRIDPYLLGALIGDGCVRSNNASLTVHKDDCDNLLAQCQIASSDLRVREQRETTLQIHIRGASRSKIMAELERIGLKGKLSHEKRIPKENMLGTTEERWRLVQGLMDTDGTATDRRAQFTTTSEGLADDMSWVLRSLGAVVTKTVKDAPFYRNDHGEKVVCRKAYTLEVKHRTPEKLFTLERKRRLAASAPEKAMCKRVVAVEVSGVVNGRCITVSEPDGLYVADDFVVTHNSHLMRVASIQWCLDIPGLQIYLFRRIFDDLIKNHVEGPSGYRNLLAPWIKSGSVDIIETEIRFKNGSKIHLCHVQQEKHKFKYQGSEIHVLLIDELTLFTDGIYRFLRNRVRMTGVELPEKYKGRFPRILCGSNPGNVGHLFVKRTFIDDVQPMKIVSAPKSEGGMLRQYIPAKLDDNPALVASDPGYADRLSGLGSAALVEAMRDGNWDVIEGAFFDCWNPKTNVVRPFKIPASWGKFASMDWGFAKPFSIGWWAVADGRYGNFPRGAMIRYREYYGAKKTEDGKVEPDVGMRRNAEDVLADILKIQKAAGEKDIPFVCDPAMWGTQSGPSIAETLYNDGKGLTQLRKADNTRVGGKGHMSGWNQMRGRIQGKECSDGVHRPMLFVFSTCTDFIRTVPAMQHDTNIPEDINTDMEDHIADETRYACNSRPIDLSQSKPPADRPKAGTHQSNTVVAPSVTDPVGWTSRQEDPHR